MKIDHLNLYSTQHILKLVAENNGLYTWYNIVKSVDQMPHTETVPPTFYVLKELVKLGYLRLDSSDEESSAKYWITHSGKEFLKRKTSNHA